MTASASLPGSLMAAMARVVSAASFLLTLPYCSRASCTERTRASCSRPAARAGSSASSSTEMIGSSPSARGRSAGSHTARDRPSKSTLMVPSGSRSIWRMRLTVPME